MMRNSPCSTADPDHHGLTVFFKGGENPDHTHRRAVTKDRPKMLQRLNRRLTMKWDAC
jgi:hypothetical protein